VCRNVSVLRHAIDLIFLRRGRGPAPGADAVDGGRRNRFYGRARARARTASHGRTARGGRAAIEAGGRALKNYLNERAAGAARHDVDPVVLGVARERLRRAVDGLMSRGRMAARGGARGGGAATYVGQDLGHAPGPAFAAGPPLHPEGAAGPVVARLVLVVVLVRRHGVCAALASTTAAADRSALCDFFESQTATFGPISPRLPKRRRRGARETWGLVLASCYSSRTPATRRRAGRRQRHKGPGMCHSRDAVFYKTTSS